MKPTYEDLEKRVRTLEKKVAREKLQDVALKKKEMIHEAIFSNIPLFMMIVDSQGNVEEVSSLLLPSAGLSLEDQTLIRGGDPLKCIHHLDDPEGCGFGPYCKTCEIRRTVQNTIDTGKPHYNIEAELISFDRLVGKKDLLLSTVLLQQSEKKVFVSIEDITEKRSLKQL